MVELFYSEVFANTLGGVLYTLAWTVVLSIPFLAFRALKEAKQHFWKLTVIAIYVFALGTFLPIAAITLQHDLQITSKSTDSLLDVYNTNPKLLDGLKKIKFDEERLWFFQSKDSTTNGIYMHAIKEIRIKAASTGTWYHEVGHHVWYHHMTYHERLAWSRYWETADHFLTNYSRKNPQEDFADTFMLYTLSEAFIRVEQGSHDRAIMLQAILRRILECAEPHCISTRFGEEDWNYAPIFIKIES